MALLSSLYLLVLLVLMVLAVPVAISMIAAAASYMSFRETMPLIVIPHKMIGGIDVFSLLAIPFFLFVGEIMTRAKFADQLVDFATDIVSRVRGNVAHASIASGVMMGTVSGVAVANTALLVSIFVPPMKRAGYPAGLAAALSAACGAIAPIMPPSVLMIVYGSVTGTSVARLFLGGIVPAFLMGIYLIAITYIRPRTHGHDTARRASSIEIGRSFVKCLPTLVAPFIILGGIIGGLFTPTEAAAVAAVYLVVLGMVGRSLNWNLLVQSAGATVLFVGQVFFIIGASASLGWILAVDHVEKPIAVLLEMMSGGNPVVLLLLVALVLLIIGTFLDAIPTLTLFAPIFFPIVTAAGVDPVHFGVVMTLLLTMGLLTPPMGICIYVACAAGNVSFAEFVRHFWHIFVAFIGVVLTLIVFPETVLFLPRVVLD